MAFFSGRNNIFSRERLKRYKRLGREQLQYLVKELAKDLEQGETLLQSLPIGIILLNKNFCPQLKNRAAQRAPLFFSLPSNPGSPNSQGNRGHQDKAKQPIWQNLQHEELALWLKNELQGKGVPQPREFQSFNADDELRVTRIEIFSQVRDGTIEGWILSISDVSELRQQERKVQQLNILASLSTVTAGVAHEIKNPLAAMSLHVQLMQRLLHKADKSEVPHCQLLEYCGIVQEEIEHLNTFVTDFLLTVRPLESELIGQDIHKVILPCLELLQLELQDKGIALELQLNRELPYTALDASMFKRLLLNLLQNAIQAIEDKSEKLQEHARVVNTVAYRGRLRLQSYHKNDKVYLEISDNGCGMSEETKKKIFDAFFTTRSKGSGLGMTMVLRILQNHNGDLQIQSEDGNGTILRLALPVFHREQRLLIEHPLI